MVKSLAVGNNKIDLVDKTLLETERKDRNKDDLILQNQITQLKDSDIEINNKIGELNSINTTTKDNLVDAINEIANKSSGGAAIVEGVPYDTGNTFNGQKIMKVMWMDIKNNADNITNMLDEVVMQHTLIDVKVLGYSSAIMLDMMTSSTQFPLPYIIFDTAGIYHITVLDLSMGMLNEEHVNFENCDKEFIKGIEVTYLE